MLRHKQMSYEILEKIPLCCQSISLSVLKSLNIWVPGGLLGPVLSLPSKHAADTRQMGNYAAQDPCLLLSVSCGKGGQKLDLKWLPGGGRTAVSVLGLCSPKLPCAGAKEMGSTGFLCWAACLHRAVFEGCWSSDDLPAMVSPCREGAGPAAGEPLYQRMPLPGAWVHVGFKPSVLLRCVALSTCCCG